MRRFGYKSLSERLPTTVNRILSGKPDLVVISQASCWGGYRFMQACHRRNIRYCSISQLNTVFSWPNDQNATEIASAFTNAEKCFFVSSQIKHLFERQIAQRLDNTDICGNPFHPSIDPTQKVFFPSTKNGWHVASVARLYPSQKGQDLLFQVLAQDKWSSRPITCNLYGDGDSELVKRLAKMHNLTNVRFHGNVPNIQDIWRENHLLVMPSRFEGLPLAIVEAMYCGRPVLVSNVAGNTELITDGVDGFVAEAATVGHLDSALEEAWQHRSQWEEMGERAAQNIRQKFGTDPVGSFVEKLHCLL